MAVNSTLKLEFKTSAKNIAWSVPYPNMSLTVNQINSWTTNVSSEPYSVSILWTKLYGGAVAGDYYYESTTTTPLPTGD